MDDILKYMFNHFISESGDFYSKPAPESPIPTPTIKSFKGGSAQPQYIIFRPYGPRIMRNLIVSPLPEGMGVGWGSFYRKKVEGSVSRSSLYYYVYIDLGNLHNEEGEKGDPSPRMLIFIASPEDIILIGGVYDEVKQIVRNSLNHASNALRNTKNSPKLMLDPITGKSSVIFRTTTILASLGCNTSGVLGINRVVSVQASTILFDWISACAPLVHNRDNVVSAFEWNPTKMVFSAEIQELQKLVDRYRDCQLLDQTEHLAKAGAGPSFSLSVPGNNITSPTIDTLKSLDVSNSKLLARRIARNSNLTLESLGVSDSKLLARRIAKNSNLAPSISGNNNITKVSASLADYLTNAPATSTSEEQEGRRNNNKLNASSSLDVMPARKRTRTSSIPSPDLDEAGPSCGNSFNLDSASKSFYKERSPSST